MKLHQLSLFLENKPHQIRMPAKLLGDAGIDILTLSLADTQQFGILRLVVDDWERAKTVLEGAGCVVRVTEVVALEVPDQPGGLGDVLACIDKGDLNIEYMYSCTFHMGDRAVLVFRFEENLDKVASVLQPAKIRFVTDEDIRKRGKR
jgi:hypothetical protein